MVAAPDRPSISLPASGLTGDRVSPRVGESGLQFDRDPVTGEITVTVFDADGSKHVRTVSDEEFAAGIFKVSHPDWRGAFCEGTRQMCRRLILGQGSNRG